MKLSTFAVLIFSLVTMSCVKPQYGNDPPPPAPLSFEIIGKDGKSMIHSANDTVGITYTDNNAVQHISLKVMKIYTNLPDTTMVSSKYNGFYITDNKQLSDLSSRSPNPVRNFNLSLNGQSLGSIYVDYWQYEANYPKPSSSALTFNNVPVFYDTTIAVPGSDINLLQLQ